MCQFLIFLLLHRNNSEQQHQDNEKELYASVSYVVSYSLLLKTHLNLLSLNAQAFLRTQTKYVEFFYHGK